MSNVQAPPSALSYAIASAILFGSLGYFIGVGASIGLFGKPTATPASASANTPEKAPASESEDEDSESEDEKHDAFASSHEECKLVLVVRTDLGMTKGKIAAQASHATLACYKSLSAQSSPILKRWERLGQAKVAVQVKSEDELEMLQAQAMSLGLCAKVIHDAGRTQIAAGSATVLGVGPGPKSVVDQVTGRLKLL
ncbi:PTH2-domain-containing protein [Aulographum hederae CBS 113979]|uniref:peptidyl-tRNA hydrolase n=1 Tax=Aulographum hederae CBS 113979 TaxID=1176131 RepID=A0A6G1HDV2_9PEZI|nr:PTH2-domain-containing protein [Aulographum hederae CBS 113979]